MVAAAIGMKNKFLFSIQTTLILTAVSLFILAESVRNELRLVTDISGAACPGVVLMFVCDINGPGNTIWNGTAFYCPSKSNEAILRHSQFNTESGTSGSCNDRTLIKARSLGVINSCFSSQLNVTVTSDLNNRTIRCSHSSDIIVTIGEIRLSVATVPYPSPSNVRLAEVRTGELIFSWEESADRPTGLYYIINSTCGTCLNMASTTMATCSDLNMSTTLTTCAFSVQIAACGTNGSSSLPVVVTLAVPDIPDAAIIPQYSQNGGQLLTAIIVHVKQNVTSFSISDTIPGSTTSYHVFSSGSNIQNQPACMEDTCEYTFDLPPTVCSGSSVDIAVASANRLGLGPPSEPITIECNNQFVKVEYDPSTTTISCVFENESDLSQKSCSVEYGMCDKATNMYVVQNSTTEDSPSTVTLKLSTIATNSKNCYVVMARFSNDTLTVMVKGSFETQSSNNMDVIVGAVIGVIMGLVAGIAIITITIVACFITRRRTEYANQPPSTNDDATQYAKEHDYELVDVNELKDVQDSLSQQNLIATADHEQMDAKTEDIPDPEDFFMVEEDRDCPTEIRSVQFKETTVQRCHTLDDLKSKFGDIIFVDYEYHSSEEFDDVMLKAKGGQLFSGTFARNLISQGKRDTWEKVFLLPKQREVSLEKGEVILHQDSDQLEKKLQLRIFDVNKETKLSEFLQQKLNKFDHDYAKVYYEFKAKMDLFCYREVIEVSNSKLKEASTGKGYIVLESSTDRGIHMFYKLKPQAPGAKVKPPADIKGGRYFVQSTPQDSDRCLKAGSLVLYQEDV